MASMDEWRAEHKQYKADVAMKTAVTVKLADVHPISRKVVSDCRSNASSRAMIAAAGSATRQPAMMILSRQAGTGGTWV